jgi:hypothetical protein
MVINSEYCLPVVKNHKVAGVEEVEHATRLRCNT